jgi:hypothetical protein
LICLVLGTLATALVWYFFRILEEQLSVRPLREIVDISGRCDNQTAMRDS